MDQNFKSWCQAELSTLLGIPVTDDVMSYVLSFESKKELESYLNDLLGADNASASKFIQEMLKRWQPHTMAQQGQKMHPKADADNKALKLGQQNILEGEKVSPKQVKQEGQNFSSSRKKNGPKKMVVDNRGSSFIDKTQLMEEERKVPGKKKGSKFVPLYSADGKAKTDVMQYPGRHACQCLGQKHGLINNCLECGRIVCSQEGSGPCLFCGSLVCTQSEMETLARNSKKSAKLYEKLMNPDVNKENNGNENKTQSDLENAIAHKNRLLDYDRTSTRRTKVIDDQADYFSLNSNWISKEQKATLQKRENELRDKRHKSRRDKTFTLDFAGRKVVEDEPDMSIYSGEDEVVKSIFEPTALGGMKSQIDRNNQSIIADPRIKIQLPKFVDSDEPRGSTVAPFSEENRGHKAELRIQDKEFQEMRDEGVCLSMHQPWASLLVKGIKRVEGRSWYTAHRGRLWIASTAQTPAPEDISMVENQYKEYYKGKRVAFPNEYPSGALLGCVDVVDCVTNEEYEAMVQDNEENGSQYIFMCENARELPVKFPVKGKHKIWKLESHIHEASKKGILRS